MLYTQYKFTCPVASEKVTQSEWDRIFGEPQPKRHAGTRKRPVCGQKRGKE